MHTCDGCVYFDRKTGSCLRDYDAYEARTARSPSGIMRLIAWVRGLFHREE